ncbi:ALP1-like protein [Tanacetum coccineum]
MNPYFATNPNDIEEERQPNSFDVDDESDVYFLQQAYQYHETLVEDENRLVLTRNPIHRDRESAEDRLMGDYFDEYEPKTIFENTDCTGRMSLSVIIKCSAAIRQLAYDSSPDAFDEYLQMSERTARDCLLYFNMCIIDLYMSKYLRKPTLEDVEKIYNQLLTRHGFPRMLGSIDCMHWEWKSCSVSWQRQYEDQQMAVTNWNDMYANLSRNMQRTWVERCEVLHRKAKELRDRETHISLQQNLMEHIWREVEDENEDEDF